MNEQRVIVESIRSDLKAEGFRKHGATWRKTFPQTILVLNIQKSQWGPQFYINLGVYLSALGPNAKPPEHRCHLRTRLSPLVAEGSPLVECLDFSTRASDEERSRVVRDAVVNYGLPWLHARSTEDGVREQLVANAGPKSFVAASAKRHVGIAS